MFIMIILQLSAVVFKVGTARGCQRGPQQIGGKIKKNANNKIKSNNNILCIISNLVGLQRGPWPEANAIRGALAWESIGTPDLAYQHSHIVLLVRYFSPTQANPMCYFTS